MRKLSWTFVIYVVFTCLFIVQATSAEEKTVVRIEGNLFIDNQPTGLVIYGEGAYFPERMIMSTSNHFWWDTLDLLQYLCETPYNEDWPISEEVYAQLKAVYKNESFDLLGLRFYIFDIITEKTIGTLIEKEIKGLHYIFSVEFGQGGEIFTYEITPDIRKPDPQKTSDLNGSQVQVSLYYLTESVRRNIVFLKVILNDQEIFLVGNPEDLETLVGEKLEKTRSGLPLLPEGDIVFHYQGLFWQGSDTWYMFSRLDFNE